MNDYIKRSDALDAVVGYDNEESIRAIPAADVRPVVRGENIGTVAECDQFICSKCGIHLENWVRVEIDEDDGDVTYHEYVFNVCPNCGADVREEESGCTSSE